MCAITRWRWRKVPFVANRRPVPVDPAALNR
jgi:hypothetical protein